MSHHSHRGAGPEALPCFELPASGPDDPQTLASTMPSRPRRAASPILLQHLILQLFRHYRLRPGEGLDFSHLAVHWAELGFDVPALMTTLQRLREAGYLEPARQPDRQLALTRRGHRRAHDAPLNLDDGQHRAQAMKLLRQTYALRRLPAA